MIDPNDSRLTDYVFGELSSSEMAEIDQAIQESPEFADAVERNAKLMEENNMLYKLKEMEYVEKIAEKIGEITVSGNGNIVTQLKEIFSGK